MAISLVFADILGTTSTNFSAMLLDWLITKPSPPMPRKTIQKTYHDIPANNSQFSADKIPIDFLDFPQLTMYIKTIQKAFAFGVITSMMGILL